jgi:hypothetical protein
MCSPYFVGRSAFVLSRDVMFSKMVEKRLCEWSRRLHPDGSISVRVRHFICGLTKTAM